MYDLKVEQNEIQRLIEHATVKCVMSVMVLKTMLQQHTKFIFKSVSLLSHTSLYQHSSMGKGLM